MDLLISIVIGLFVLSFPLCLAFSMRSLVARIAASLMALALVPLFAFGFLASFELPMSQGWPWHLGYGLLGVAALATPVLLVVLAGRRERAIERLK